MAADPALAPFTVCQRREIAGTAIAWQQPAKILPIDPLLRETILAIESDVEAFLAQAQADAAHLPSRLRSLVWISCSLRHMAERGMPIADEDEVRRELAARLPAAGPQLPAMGVASA